MPKISSVFKAAALVAIVAFGGWFLYLTYGPKLAIEDILPSGAVAYARLSHPAQHWQRGKKSEFWKNITAIDVRKVLARNNVPAAKVAQIENWRSQTVQFFDNPLAQKVLGKEAAVAIYRHKDANAAKDPDGGYGILLVLRLEPSVQAAEFLSHFTSQWGKGIATSEDLYQNKRIVHLQFKDKNMRLKYVRLNDLLILTMEDEKELNTLIDVYRRQHPSLKQDEDFASMRSRTYPGADGLFYVNAQVMAPVGFKTYAISYLPGKSVNKYKLIAGFEPQALGPSLRKLTSCEAKEGAAMPFVPSDIIAYQWGNCYDLPEMWQQFKEEMQANGMQKRLGLKKISADLFPALGKEAGGYLTDIDTLGLFPYPRFLVFARVNDRTKAEEALKGIIKNPLGMMREEKYGQVDIHHMPLPLGANMDPGYCFLGDYLLAATSSQLLKKSIDTFHDPAGSLASDKTFNALELNSAQKVQSMAFAKVSQLARRLQDVLGWSNKYLSSQVAMVAVYKQEAQEKKKELQTALAAKEVESKMAMERLARWQAKLVEGLSPDEQAAITGAVGNLQASAQELQDGAKTIVEQQKQLDEAVANYDTQADSAKLVMFNSQQVFMPILKGLEVIEAQGIKVLISNNVIETELMVK